MCLPSAGSTIVMEPCSTVRQFHYDQANDTFRCPAGQTLIRKQQKKDKPCVVYTAAAAACRACALKSRCTPSRQRYVTVHLHEAALDAHASARHYCS